MADIALIRGAFKSNRGIDHMEKHSINLQRKSGDSFLYDWDLRHEGVQVLPNIYD